MVGFVFDSPPADSAEVNLSAECERQLLPLVCGIVEAAVAALRDPEETWDFGILDDATPPAASPPGGGGGISDDDAVSSLRRSLRSPF